MGASDLAYLAVVELSTIQATRAKSILERTGREDYPDISGIKSVERASPGDSDEKVKKTDVEDLLWIGLCFAADPDARTASHDVAYRLTGVLCRVF